MNDDIWHLRSRMEEALNPIFDMFQERQFCLRGMKPRSDMSALQYDADKLDMALMLSCERMPLHLVEPTEQPQSPLATREVNEMTGGNVFVISVNRSAGYDLVVHTLNEENWLHYEALKLAAVIGTICSPLYNAFDADPEDTYGILDFTPSGQAEP